MAGTVATMAEDEQNKKVLSEEIADIPAKWGEEKEERLEKEEYLQRQTEVTPKDKFKLGTKLIYWILLGYVIAAAVNCLYGDIESVKVVWQNASVFFQSVLMLIIGYYFGSKEH